MKDLHITIKERNGRHKQRLDEVSGTPSKCARYIIAKYGGGLDAFIAKHQLEFEESVKNVK